MAVEPEQKLILVVTGACLRAETMDRPLAYRVREAAERRLGPDAVWHVVVLSDVWYLNSAELHAHPVVSIGGPGVNGLSRYLYQRLPQVLLIDQVLLIQMDLAGPPRKASVWGTNHEQTVEAVTTFLQKGYLDRFLEDL